MDLRPKALFVLAGTSPAKTKCEACEGRPEHLVGSTCDRSNVREARGEGPSTLARLQRAYWIHSLQRWTAPLAPQGMIGTLEVEFCGEPSISLSE